LLKLSQLANIERTSLARAPLSRRLYEFFLAGFFFNDFSNASTLASAFFCCAVATSGAWRHAGAAEMPAAAVSAFQFVLGAVQPISEL
jgi:hypothetical protein